MSRKNRSSRSGCGINIFNVLTIFVLGIALLLALGIILVVTVPGLIPDSVRLMVSGPTATPQPIPTVIQLAELPTEVPTLPGGVILPTWTPIIESLDSSGPVLQPTNTRRPTAIPTETSILPTRTPTPTHTNTPTSTPTEGPTPTPSNTPSPFLFTKDERSPQYLQNYANNAGCNWLGIAGEVLNVAGNPVAPNQYVVHVWDSGIDARVNVGGAPAYGPSGWEQFVYDQPIVRSYNIQLESVNGTPVSQVYRVNTAASCQQNLLFFTFVQNR
ncbi:MAG: hypothetical protein KJ063_00405 [Anaerolineae bacterium]|nr:hypothetical protein [Anaerolineae bacterium]